MVRDSAALVERGYKNQVPLELPAVMPSMSATDNKASTLAATTGTTVGLGTWSDITVGATSVRTHQRPHHGNHGRLVIVAILYLSPGIWEIPSEKYREARPSGAEEGYVSWHCRGPDGGG